MDPAARHRQLQLLGIELRAREPLHWPKGVPVNPDTGIGGGRFRSPTAALVAAVRAWVKGGKVGQEPLAGHNRETARRVAAAMGMHPPQAMQLAPLKSLIYAHAGKESDWVGDAAKWHLSLEGLDDMLATMHTAEVGSEQMTQGALGDTGRVDYANGKSLAQKLLGDVSRVMGPGFEPRRQADAEQLAALVGEALGAPVPRVLRMDEDEIFVDWVDGETGDKAARRLGLTEEEFGARMAVTDDGFMLGLFDILTGSWDRSNITNWLVDDQGGVHGIDHALSFWDGGGPATDPPTLAIGPFAAAWFLRAIKPGQPPTLGWKDNPLAPADIDLLRQAIGELEDDFDALGRHDWFEFMQHRLDALAAHATGTKGILT